MTISLRTPSTLRLQLLGATLSAMALVGCSADEGPSTAISTPVPVPTPTPVPVPVPTPVPTPTPADPAPVIGTLSATPATVVTGASSTIDYAASGAVSCVATGQWTGTALATSGSQVVTVPTTPGVYSYGLTCTNATGQQTSRSINITVISTPVVNDVDIIGGGPGSPLPNDGTVPTSITDGGTPVPGAFVCKSSGRIYGDAPTTTVTLNGLLGPGLTTLLDQLGGGTVTQLLNSVTAKESVVDRNLDTFAQYNLTAGLLTLPMVGNVVSSVDLNVGLNSQVPAGKYAVFGLTFPAATVEATLMQTLTITTFNGTALAETREISLSQLDLLGTALGGQPALFAGFKTTKPYDSVSISLDPSVLSANVGNAMNVHELCTNGVIQTP